MNLFLNESLAPIYFHCLDGTLITSLVCMCLRKLLGDILIYK
jgi:protein tyrosine/serine phosphatase